MLPNKPKIIFGMPKIAGLDNLIEEALRLEGFDVISLPQLANSSGRYPSLLHRIYAKYRKIVYKDKDIAMEMKSEVLRHKLEKLLGNSRVDYTLMISADIYSTSLIKFIKEKTTTSCANYQFDGLHRFPKIYDRIPLFDHFYVFDESDISNTDYPVDMATNFYFPHLCEDLPQPQYDFYFTGSHQVSRLHHINDFVDWATGQGFTLDFTIIGKNIRNDYLPQIHTKNDLISFRDNIINSQLSRVLVDFVINDHKGLSFRTFEALGMKKKLITTNAEVKKYNFYHPNNIFIWSENNSDDLKDFLQRPYHPIAPEISQQYAFSNWVKRILHIE